MLVVVGGLLFYRRVSRGQGGGTTSDFANL